MAHSEGFGIGWEKRQGKTFTSTDWLSNGKQQTRDLPVNFQYPATKSN